MHDDLRRVIPSSLLHLFITQITLILHALHKRHQFYTGLLDKRGAGSDTAAGGLFARFTGQISHHFQSLRW